MYCLNIDPLNPDGLPTVPELLELGVEAVRLSYIDKSVDVPYDYYRLSFYTDILKQLADVRIQSLIIFHYDTFPGKPAPEAHPSEWNIYTDQFVSRVSQLATLLSPLTTWFQIWNEPDFHNRPDYSPGISAATYGHLLKRTYENIKAFVPQATIFGGGLASGNPKYWEDVVDSQRIEGTDIVPPLLDVNCYHPYGQQPVAGWPSSDWGFGNAPALHAAYKAVYSGPWWITEIGCETEDNEFQAEYLERFYQSMGGKADQIFWFCYTNRMVHPFGLLDDQQQRKKSWYTFQEIATR